MFYNYDPGQVVMVFKGVQMMGFASGTFIKASRSEDAFSMVAGAHGDVTRVRSRNRTGSVTVMLQAGSPVNDLLSAILASDELAGLGVGPLMVKDNNGNTLITAANAWIRKIPDGEFADDQSDREWILDCAVLTFDPLGGALTVL